MPITINGNGTITGLSVGGLPDGSVDRDTLASGAKGSVLQVQTTNNTTLHAKSNSTSWADVSGLSCAITPTAASNKVIVSITLCVSKNDNHGLLGRVYRDSTLIGGGVGDQGNHEDNCWWNIRTAGEYSPMPYNVTYVDTIPSDWSSGAITYKVQVRTTWTGIYFAINGSVMDGNNDHESPGMSTIVLTEIAA
tara:strand:+ start:674 stop:1252 length:579 start_codon:yes stop_codon:yes gene_type:complete